MLSATRLTLFTCFLASSVFAQTGFQIKSFNLPAGQEKVLSADLNQDGKPDLVVYGGNSAAVMLNTGGGNFTSPVVIDSSIFVTDDLEAADFNGDGILDLAACGTDSRENAFLMIYLNDGTGHFTKTEAIAEPQGCTGIQVGDVNHDGKEDVLTGTVTTWFGDGAGHLGNPVSQTLTVNPAQHPEITGCFPSAMRAGHFLTDNSLDLLITGVCNNPPGQPTIDYGTLYFGHSDGTGHFTLSEAFEADVTWEFTGDAVDVNHDGRLDVLMKHRLDQIDNTQVLYAMDVAFNQGGGQFNVSDIFNLNATNSFSNTFVVSGTAGEYDLDGLPDVVVGYENMGTMQMSMVDGESNGTWNIAQTWNVSGTPQSAITKDFNGDGHPDIAAIMVNPDLTSTLFVYLNGNVTSCPAPAQPGVNVCAPLAESAYASPVAMIGTGTGASGTVRIMELWIDGNKIGDFQGNQINTTVNLAKGKHAVTMVELDSNNNFVKSTPVSFTVN